MSVLTLRIRWTTRISPRRLAKRSVDAVPGEVQRYTPSIEALYVPNIDEALDDEAAKRAFWNAFRALGDWYEALPPY